jgi:hypothetical protein
MKAEYTETEKGFEVEGEGISSISVVSEKVGDVEKRELFISFTDINNSGSIDLKSFHKDA